MQETLYARSLPHRSFRNIDAYCTTMSSSNLAKIMMYCDRILDLLIIG